MPTFLVPWRCSGTDRPPPRSEVNTLFLYLLEALRHDHLAGKHVFFVLSGLLLRPAQGRVGAGQAGGIPEESQQEGLVHIGRREGRRLQLVVHLATGIDHAPQ